MAFDKIFDKIGEGLVARVITNSHKIEIKLDKSGLLVHVKQSQNTAVSVKTIVSQTKVK